MAEETVTTSAPFATYDDGRPNPAYHEWVAADRLRAAERWFGDAHDDETVLAAAAIAQAHATLALAIRTGQP